MQKIIWICLILLAVGSLSYTDGTDLAIHHQSAIDRINNEEELYDDDTRPGAFDVSYEGIDSELNGPKFHITFVSNERYSSYSDWTYRFDVTSYVDGMVNEGYISVDNGTAEINKVIDENGNATWSINHDFYLIYPNPDDLDLSHIYTFGLTRLSQQGYIMFAINEVEFEIEYIPTDDEDLINFQGETPVVEDITDIDDKKQNATMGRIFGLIGGLGAGAVGAAILLKRRKKVKVYKKKKAPKIIPKKKNILTKIADGVKIIGQKAVDGLQYVSRGINKGYESLKKIGINTRFGRLEVGDVVGLTGADQIMNVNKTINDLCDVINQKKDISKLYKNMINHLINSKIGKLKNIIGRGLKVDAAKLKKLVNIGKEINVIKGLIKDGISVNEILDFKAKIKPYQDAKNIVDIGYDTLNGAKQDINKKIDVVGSNSKKLLKGII